MAAGRIALSNEGKTMSAPQTTTPERIVCFTDTGILAPEAFSGGR